MEYPVTPQEMINCLEKMKSECNPHMLGDMRPVILSMAINMVKTQEGLAKQAYDFWGMEDKK